MAWNGYFRYQNTEVINATRTRAYADALGLAWVKNTSPDGSDYDGLAEMLGDGAYVHPVLDNAPWYDPDRPESGNFAGLIPLDVGGLDDSTRQSDVFEYTTDGGNPGVLRNGTKTGTFSVALVGVDEEAVDYGYKWLKRALMRRDCTPGTGNTCHGEVLYFSRCKPGEVDHQPDLATYDGGPVVATTDVLVDGGSPSTLRGLILDGGDPENEVSNGQPSLEWLTNFERHFNNVLFNRGPIVNSKRTLAGCNGVVWLVSFTCVAGDPFEYGNSIPVLESLASTTPVANPYYPPYTGDFGAATYTIEGCAKPTYQPIYDPAFPALVSPPAPPNVTPQGWVVPTGNWQRRYADIPDETMPLWDEVRPIITIRADHDIRRMRVRFYRAASFDPTADCGEAGEFYISWMPGDTDMVIDGENKAVYIVSDDGSTRRADSLVYGSEYAAPIKWFAMSCGDSWHVAMDREQYEPDTLITMSMSLVPRSAS